MEDGMNGTLEITRDGDTTFVQWHGPQGRVEITTEEMDHLIATLAGWRGTMEPQVPMEKPGPAPNGTYLVVTDPAYWVQPEVLNGDALMHLRHPNLGWLSFLFPRAESKRLSQLLEGVADAPPNHLGPRQ
jgi:hypothetical protein